MLGFGETAFEVHGVVMDVMRSEDQQLKPGEKPPAKPWRSVMIKGGRDFEITVSAGTADWDVWRVGDFVVVRGALVFEAAREENGRQKAAKIKIKNVSSLLVRQGDGKYTEQLGTGHGAEAPKPRARMFGGSGASAAAA